MSIRRSIHPPKAMKPGRKRKLVDEVCDEWRVSMRKACEALKFDRSTYHYKSRRSGQAAKSSWRELPKEGGARWMLRC
nr:hypothetical protein [Bradyrhizobium sp. Cp5.3]